MVGGTRYVMLRDCSFAASHNIDWKVVSDVFCSLPGPFRRQCCQLDNRAASLCNQRHGRRLSTSGGRDGASCRCKRRR